MPVSSVFTVGKPVTGADLAGREKEVQRITQYLRSGQSVVLIAPRRYGKTSVVLEVLGRLREEDGLTAYVDFFASPTQRILAENIISSVLENRKLAEAFHKFKSSIKELLRSVELKQVIADFEFILDFAQKDTDSYQLLLDSLDFIQAFSSKYAKSIYVGFDEFGDLKKMNGDEIVKAFRSKIQLQDRCAYIFSGSYESVMNTLFVHPSAPFYRFAQLIDLDLLEMESFRAYLGEKFRSIDIQVQEKQLNTVLNFTGNHPYYTQQVCQQVEFLAGADKTVTDDLISEAIHQAVIAERSYLERVWEDLAVHRENIPVVLSLAREESPYQVLNPKRVNIARVLKRLILRGVLKKKNDRYVFTDPLLLWWIRKTILSMDL